MKETKKISFHVLIKRASEIRAGALWRPFVFLPLVFFFACSGVNTGNLKVPQDGAGHISATHPGGKRLLENVPFYIQEDHQCGPASLAEVMNFYGAKTTPEAIASSIYSKTAKGTLAMDMLIYSNRSGFDATQYSGGAQDVVEKIDRGIPLIVFVDYGFWVYQHGHFMVVVGYDASGPIVYSGYESYKHISWEDFMTPWKRTGFWTLLLTPKDNAMPDKPNQKLR